jgi:hypothetical protein
MDGLTLTEMFVQPKGRYNVISVSAFKLEKGYKDERVYLDGLVAMVASVVEMGIPFYVRIYFDNSVRVTGTNWARALKLLSENPIVQLVHYDCPKFKTAKGYHEGLFGTLMRFIPLFDYKANAKLETVFVTDIDNSFNGRGAAAIRMFAISASQFHFRTKACYHATDRLASAERNLPAEFKPSFKQRIVAAMIIQKNRFPAKIMDEFMDCLSDKCEYLVQNYNRHTTANVVQSEIQAETLLSYGIDEFFVNTTMLKYVDTSGMPFSYTVDVDMERGLIDKRLESAEADAWCSKILGFKPKSPRRALANMLANTSGPRYQEILKNYISALEAAYADKTYVALGFTEAQVQCALENGRMKPSPFVLETRETRSFAQMMKDQFPKHKVTVLDAANKAIIDQLKSRTVLDSQHTLADIITVLKGSTDKMYLKGGIVRNMVQGFDDFRDIDLASYPNSAFLVTRRLGKLYGDDIDMRPLTIIPVVQLCNKVEPEIDISDLATDISNIDALCNSLLVDMDTYKLYDPSGRGLADAKSKTFRYTAPFEKMIVAKGADMMWRRLKFALKGYSFIESETAQLYKWVFENHHTVTNASVWSNAAFTSNIPSDRVVEAFTIMKDEIDDLASRGKLDFNSGDFLMLLVEKGTFVPNFRLRRPVPAPAPTIAPKPKNNNRGKQRQNKPRRPNRGAP